MTQLYVQAIYEAIAKDPTIYRATEYISPDLTIKITRRHKLDKREKQVEFILTIGKPNYAERAYIKKFKKDGETFPLNKLQVKTYPTTIKRKAA